MTVKILIDADACPKQIKEIVFKAALKKNIPVFVVANAYQNVPISPLIKLVVVEKGPDVADQWIIDNVGDADFVVTSDIPLASAAVDGGALVVTSYGKRYDASNVKEALASRNLMMELRQGGEILATQKPFGVKDREKFANVFNQWVARQVKIA